LKFSLTYIIATRNRLPFLKITLGRLIKEVLPDEEIVIVDGDSTDGSKIYLQQLFEEGKIHQYISEPDKNQAHAWNKAMLMASGTVIKKIIDDDVFCYEAIRLCKTYMLQHPEVDVVISNDLSSILNDHQNIHILSRLPQFEKWKSGLSRSFTFSDVNMLIKRSALAYIGLYNTDFVMMDWEYSLRISHLKAEIAYYTGYNSLSVGHPETVTSLKNNELIKTQGQRGAAFYEYEGDGSDITLWSKIKIVIGKALYRIKTVSDASQPPVNDIDAVYGYYNDYILKLNCSQQFNFFRGG
jgi:glycosyltransferase involved in cell wall biosynthesis